MTEQEILEIQRGCEGVTEGPWMAAEGGTTVVGLPIVASPMGAVIANCMWAPSAMPHADEMNKLAQARADHIARLDPATVRELCQLALKGLKGGE